MQNQVLIMLKQKHQAGATKQSSLFYSFEISRNTQRWHFCTTSNINKLETVKNLIESKFTFAMAP